MRLGYSKAPERPGERPAGFNEAEAHAPRILYPMTYGSTRGRCCFNEAEAHAPRILYWHRPHPRDAGRASMRPRRMRLGYQTKREIQRTIAALLQ